MLQFEHQNTGAPKQAQFIRSEEIKMNDFSYQAMAKEKIANLQKEGIRSQSFYRSGVPKLDLLRGLPKLIPIILGSLGILALLVR